MSTLAESIGTGPPDTQIHDALVAGVDVLGQQQTVDFVPYVRTVLPLDGFVFWLNAALLTTVQLAQHGLQSPAPVTVAGSLHYASIGHMVEDETIAVRRVDFTAETQVTALAEIAPDVMYVATWNAPLGSFKFTFSQRSTYYQQANVHHYVGDAVYPVFEAQLIDDISAFDQRQVVSNSLPLWLQMVQSVPYVSQVTPIVGLSRAAPLALYPAYFVPPNLPAPYGVVDIPPNSLRPLAMAPFRSSDNSRYQSVTERATLTFYGLRNDEVMDFLDYSLDYSLNTGIFGIMNSPVPRDERRSQIELATLAQKKVVEYEVSYHQRRARDVAQQFIQAALIGNIYPSDGPIVPNPPPVYQPITV